MNRKKVERIKKAMSEIQDALSNIKQILSSEDTEVDDSEAYNKGLEDGWELTKKLFCPPRYNGIDGKTLSVLFETDIHNIPARYTAQEALAKLEAYENEIKVGDEISVLGNEIKGYVIDESKECEDCYVVLITNYKDLHTAIYNKTVIKKTGKHIDLTDLFKQIGGGE